MADQCYLLISPDDGSELPGVQELKTQLEKGNEVSRIETMKKILLVMLNGDTMPQLLMFVIRFVMPSKNKTLKKLLLIYLELIPKKSADGKLKQEMILVCNALRNDLQHPNEYVRGSTLRFLCKLKEIELLEPLVPTVRACLEHRHSYVRKNAILAIYSIYKNFENLIPDAPELIHNILEQEGDLSCKRNAFLMLVNTDHGRAVDYLASNIQQVFNFGDQLQLVAIELIRKVCKSSTQDKGKYIKAIYALLNTSSQAVKYEAASNLVSLTSAPPAVKAAASCYIELITKESDNNVKLIVLEKLSELRQKHEGIFDDLVMDLLRVLSSPDIAVRRKCLQIALDMVSSRDAQEVVQFLKKELVKTADEGEFEKAPEYRKLLINAIHVCAVNFPEVVSSVVHALMDLLTDPNNSSAIDVTPFLREVVERLPELTKDIVSKLLQMLSELKQAKVLRGVLWIIGEYALSSSEIEEAFLKIRSSIGEIPILAAEMRAIEAEKNIEKESAVPASPTAASAPKQRVLADGTYATESAFANKSTTSPAKVSDKSDRPPLRDLLIKGDYFLGTVLATSLAKLALRYRDVSHDSVRINAITAEAMLIMTGIIRLGRSEFVGINKIDEDSYERVLVCLRVLSSPTPETNEVFLSACRQTFAALLSKKRVGKAAVDPSSGIKSIVSKEPEKKFVQADDLITFRQLKGKRSFEDGEDEFELDLTRATGQNDRDDDLKSKLSRVIQLTGFSDPIYAEAYVNVHQYDVVLDVLIVNQTQDTLQNVSLEFATLGDLKLVERPPSHVLGGYDFATIKANIKVSSTETGTIFGNIIYDGPGALESNCIVLNDIHIDIMDYIQPAQCSEKQFLGMWQEFEWENKVPVTTNITDLRIFLKHIMKSTNMGCLTPEFALEGECGFLAANLYARSIFGEDALVNVCVELHEGKIVGNYRIRTKTQGIAISLGEKIASAQKAPEVPGK